MGAPGHRRIRQRHDGVHPQAGLPGVHPHGAAACGAQVHDAAAADRQPGRHLRGPALPAAAHGVPAGGGKGVSLPGNLHVLRRHHQAGGGGGRHRNPHRVHAHAPRLPARAAVVLPMPSRDCVAHLQPPSHCRHGRHRVHPRGHAAAQPQRSHAAAGRARAEKLGLPGECQQAWHSGGGRGGCHGARPAAARRQPHHPVQVHGCAAADCACW
mmetsp:Transcript_27118/g.68106  ORF Transcript_27118/g.68106 Transcript_27118/m.68106 type:complete len:212 (-) Transcript_27118:992-1627(-)